ncbi:TetR/AcrR family transcriptional regulator [Pseudomonas sp. N040]|uniref:TetR/AcrR family transcriptional regulator n=1 Tax=Pseudomonas sp. N040 TaxID=2785325 RepID=UPI0018A29940|nr:TetR family transcriptional regulator [Pseudomonas sp. N040]MBF7730628.1 TetR family transcriptional regulator [Pseudomonas sp. N040]MBW7014271.1 TetR family transcriptional regulator [Pseudomonas sp. N040]
MTNRAVGEGASEVASALAESIQYQGRKASRKGSEQRRQAILDAAMRIIVRDGVRAVRHRAVAAEAGVPLSATTYYFKDINDLITDTFAQFVEHNAAMLSRFWADAETDLQALSAGLKQDEASRRAVVDHVVERALLYVRNQLRDNRDGLLAEQALRLEALNNPALRQVSMAHQQILASGVDLFFEALGSKRPREDAHLLTSIILRMEYQGLLVGLENIDVDETRGILKRYLYLVTGL